MTPCFKAGFSQRARRRAVVSVLFAAQWRTGGTDSAAILDGTRFTTRGGTGGSVVTAASAGLTDWPTANALRIPSASGEGWCFPRKTGLGVPAVGATRYYRVYVNVQVPDDSSDAASHPIQDGNAASDTNWMFEVYHDVAATNGLWRLSFWPGNGVQSNPAYQRFTLTQNLTKGTTYRVEWSYHRTGTATANLHARVSTATGSLLYGDADFLANDGAGPGSLADNPTLDIPLVANLDGLNCGLNQSDWTTGGLWGYQGAVAVSDESWLGAYNAATEANF